MTAQALDARAHLGDGDGAKAEAVGLTQTSTEIAQIQAQTAVVVAQQRAEPGLQLVAVFERLAKDPAVDVSKLRELIELQRAILAREAESAFWTAFVQMQPELPKITKDGAIVNSKTNTLQSKYSTNEAIQTAVRPILARYGFGLSFRHTFQPDAESKDGKMNGWDTTVGVLAHNGGHIERDQFMARADQSGNKNDVQALGSTRSYGERYTTKSLLNIVSEGEDDNGAAASRRGVVDPEGFEAWKAALEGIAPAGVGELETAWGKSRPEFKTHLVQHYRDQWATMKRTAEKANL